MNEILVKYGISAKLGKFRNCTSQPLHLWHRGITGNNFTDHIPATAIKWSKLENKRKTTTTPLIPFVGGYNEAYHQFALSGMPDRPAVPWKKETSKDTTA